MHVSTTFFFISIGSIYAIDVSSRRHPLGDGHLKKFGEGGPRIRIAEVNLFPSPGDFFKNYASKSQPVMMKDAIKTTNAYKFWTDDYFLNLDGPADYIVLVETRKKENRTQPSSHMSFKDFVMVYGATDQYMVEPVPHFLRKDVTLPGPLQCEDIIDGQLVENIMWFSSGGTKSVVHTDAVDNIICLVSGDKEFVLVDPHRYGTQVDLDHPEGMYSSVDVDRVDYDRFPGLAEVEFHVANLTAGDCLFIPYKWIHQVNSYGRNIAVNVWWDFHRNELIDLTKCNTAYDVDLTLYDVEFAGFSSVESSPANIRSHLEDAIKYRKAPIDRQQFRKIGLGPLDDPAFIKRAGTAHNVHVEKIFSALDRNADGSLTDEDLLICTNEDWSTVVQNIKYLAAIIKRVSADSNGPYDDSRESAQLHEEL